MTSVVEMIGGGPGDPDLLTLRAEAALAAATVVVVDPELAHLAAAFSPAASISISAAAGGGGVVDGDAVRILTGAARRDERVVRLYVGDPWLHPAYAVEAALLASAGVDHVAVPGLSVALAAPAAAGLAVHHPSLALALTTAAPAALPRASDPARTLVTVTDDAAATAAALVSDGDPAMPVAAVHPVHDGVRVAHRGTLASLAADPAIGRGVLVVGAVVAPSRPGAP
jgi:uroporphyrin-III C-methyltransferase/precorrin-2 dehydrogenase/sirohydrochlorin ferrochelatase